MSAYSICKLCGAPHDDGTAELCMNCLDKKVEAPEDVQELTKYKCTDCCYCKNHGYIDKKGDSHQSMICNNKFCDNYCKNIAAFKSVCNFFILKDCLHCEFAMEVEEDSSLIYCMCEKSTNYNKFMGFSDLCDCYEQNEMLCY